MPRLAHLAAVGVVGALAVLVMITGRETWTAVLTFAVLVAVGLIGLNALLRTEPDPRLRRLVQIALVLKVSSGFARYLVNALVYDGGGDASAYAQNGERLSQAWLAGEWISSGRPFPGTAFIDGLTAALYTITGPAYVAGFFVFAWMGFWGLYLCFRAFTLAVPNGNHFRYAVLVLLLPSLLFWPSAIGKDAWMILCIGIFAYGTARLLRAMPGGLLLIALGAVGTGLVRPHITLILLLSLSVAMLVGRGEGSSGGGVQRALLLGVVLLAGLVALSQVQSFFAVAADENLADALDETARRTNSGGSQFDGASIRNPATVPYGVITVLFRPFPFEATNLQALATSLEGTLLLVLFALALPRLRDLRRTLAAQPYIAFCLTYTLLFGAAFSSFNNFGILTRQRVQVFPLTLALLALPLVVARSPRGVVNPPEGRQLAEGSPDNGARQHPS